MKVDLMIVLTTGLFITGCASSISTTPDGRHIGITTVDDGPDRSASYVQLLERDEETGSFREVAGELHVGPTIAGQAIVGSTQGLGPSFVQGYFGERIADSKSAAAVDSANIMADAYRDSSANNANAIVEATQITADGMRCPEGVFACHGDFTVVEGGDANAGSSSQSGSTANNTIPGPCPGGTCVRSPID